MFYYRSSFWKKEFGNMNQNVFGVILFSFIVGTAIFASEFFVTLPTLPAVYERPATTAKNHYSCSRQSRVVYRDAPAELASVKVTQAYLNQRTNQLNTDFLIKRENPNTQSVGISLHLFVKNGRTTQYLATETINVKPDFDADGKANHDVLSSFQWLDDLENRDNLYVIAESSVNFRQSKTPEPKFDSTNATPVLLMKAK
jgi:hypothetical protein